MLPGGQIRDTADNGSHSAPPLLMSRVGEYSVAGNRNIWPVRAVISDHVKVSSALSSKPVFLPGVMLRRNNFPNAAGQVIQAAVIVLNEYVTREDGIERTAVLRMHITEFFFRENDSHGRTFEVKHEQTKGGVLGFPVAWKGGSAKPLSVRGHGADGVEAGGRGEELGLSGAAVDFHVGAAHAHPLNLDTDFSVARLGNLRPGNRDCVGLVQDGHVLGVGMVLGNQLQLGQLHLRGHGSEVPDAQVSVQASCLPSQPGRLHHRTTKLFLDSRLHG